MHRREEFSNALVRALGWFVPLLFGDPSIFDRWLWLRGQLSPGGARTLDAGCGSGAFTLYAARRGNEVIGLSSSERNNQVAQQRAGILKLPRARFLTRDLRHLDSFAADLGSFDQIICFETIEHVIDDQRLITGLGRLLAPGGRLFVTSPSDRHRPFPGERLSDDEDGGHVRFGYSHDDLRRLFANAGLQPASLGYVTGTLSQHLMRLQHWIGRFSPVLAWSVIVPFRPLQVFDRAVTSFAPAPYFCVTGVAVRPSGPAAG